MKYKFEIELNIDKEIEKFKRYEIASILMFLTNELYNDSKYENNFELDSNFKIDLKDIKNEIVGYFKFKE